MLGGVAKYVAKNDEEPLDPAHGGLNLNLIELDGQEMPEGPQKVGSSGPHVLTYLLTLAAAGLCFLVMREANVPLRDDAVFELVRDNNTPPNLRAYLVDERNTLHRNEVVKLFGAHYTLPITNVKVTATDRKLGAAMGGLLEGLKTADAPALSVRTAETKSPAGMQGGAQGRADQVRDRFAAKAGLTIGSELVAFVEAPDEARPHIDIACEFVPDARRPDRYTLTARVAIRERIEDEPKAVSNVTYPRPVAGKDAGNVIESFTDQLALAVAGRPLAGNNGRPRADADDPE